MIIHKAFLILQSYLNDIWGSRSILFTILSPVLFFMFMEMFELYEAPVANVWACQMEGVLCTSNENVGEEDGNGFFVQ